MKDVLLEQRGHIAILTLNRPEVLNAIGMRMAEELHQALDEVDTNEDIRVLVITGSGMKSFCAGADLKERGKMTKEEMWRHTTLIKDAFRKLEQLRVPVIAAIQGFALGGGTELAISCDLRVIAADAEIGLTEVRLGVFPGAGGPVRLPRVISVGDAKDMIFTGRRITGREAKEMRFAQRLVEKREDVLPEALKLAEQIAANGPKGVQAVKKVINYGLQVSTDLAMQYSDMMRKPLDATDDYEKSLERFSNKNQD